MTRGCALCHTIRGTDAGGGLDPTSPIWPAAARWRRARCRTPSKILLAWIADPQSIKPGNKMPKVPLDRSELDALGDYLGTLQ